METSTSQKSSQYPIASPDGQHLAILTTTHLEIRTALSLQLVRSIPLHTNKSPLIRWSPIRNHHETSTRISLSDEDNARVWDLTDKSWSAVVNNGSAGMGRIVNTEFGRSKDELLLFSDFGSKVTVCSLISGRSVEIRDPKYATKGSGFRPVTGVFAMLSRPGPQDFLTIHAPNSYKVLKSITLPTTDAQGLKWSPDGRWLVVWDTATLGIRVYIYTADGHLYRSFSGDGSAEINGLGVKCIEWSPNGQYLAIGSYDRRAVILGTRTFSPVMYLDHTASIQLTEGGTVWQEQVLASSQRSYIPIQQPVSPPVASPSTSDQTLKAGISLLAFNSSGTMIATRDDTTPTTVWLWDLNKLAATAVIIQHSPVRQLCWHPHQEPLLLIHCTQDESFLHLWDSESREASIYPVDQQRTAGKLDVTWLLTEGKPAILLGNSKTFSVCWPQGKSTALSAIEEEGDQSYDSVFEALTGKTPSKRVDHTEILVSDIVDDTEFPDDTFVGRRQMGAMT